MIDIRPFRQADLPYPSSKENAFWFENHRSFDESTRIRRQYIATDASQVVGYGCLEQPRDDFKTLRVLVVCGPANLYGQVSNELHLRLVQDAKELGATTLWAREYQGDENLAVFLASRAFVEGYPNGLPDHAPIIMFKLELQPESD